jgi:hypothetical protein
VRLNRCVTLVCLTMALLVATSLAQSAPGFRTRDRQSSRNRGNSNRSTRTGRSTGEFPARNLPAEFAILRTNSIFSRDRLAAPVADSGGRNGPPSQSSRPTSPIFRGVLNEGTLPLAGIERSGSSTITWYREGQTLGFGEKITTISLNQITITRSNGDRRVIEVGDRIDGGTAISRELGNSVATTQPAAASALLTRGDDEDATD